jgi:hypothetical protein
VFGATAGLWLLNLDKRGGGVSSASLRSSWLSAPPSLLLCRFEKRIRSIIRTDRILAGGGADDEGGVGVEDEDDDEDDALVELLASRDGAGGCWLDCSVYVDAAQWDPSLARFGMGLIGRSSEGRSRTLVEQGESSRAAWPLVRFTTDGN